MAEPRWGHGSAVAGGERGRSMAIGTASSVAGGAASAGPVILLLLLVASDARPAIAVNSAAAFVQNAVYSNKIAIFSKSYCMWVPKISCRKIQMRAVYCLLFSVGWISVVPRRGLLSLSADVPGRGSRWYVLFDRGFHLFWGEVSSIIFTTRNPLRPIANLLWFKHRWMLLVNFSEEKRDETLWKPWIFDKLIKILEYSCLYQNHMSFNLRASTMMHYHHWFIYG